MGGRRGRLGGRPPRRRRRRRRLFWRGDRGAGGRRRHVPRCGRRLFTPSGREQAAGGRRRHVPRPRVSRGRRGRRLAAMSRPRPPPRLHRPSCPPGAGLVAASAAPPAESRLLGDGGGSGSDSPCGGGAAPLVGRQGCEGRQGMEGRQGCEGRQGWGGRVAGQGALPHTSPTAPPHHRRLLLKHQTRLRLLRSTARPPPPPPRARPLAGFSAHSLRSASKPEGRGIGEHDDDAGPRLPSLPCLPSPCRLSLPTASPPASIAPAAGSLLLVG